jgi:hypothetical protein
VTPLTYQRPNGGKRILNSAYTGLTNRWVRTTGLSIDPRDMSIGHLQNTLNLLKESHGNLTERASIVIGKIHAHYTDPHIRQQCVNLLQNIEEQEVDDVYPVWRALAAELESRLPDNDSLHWGHNQNSFDFEWDDK